MKDIIIQIETLDFTKSIKFYSDFYGLSLNAIRNRFKKLGVYDKFLFIKNDVSTIKSQLLQIEYNKNSKLCPQCKTKIPYEKRKQIYCSLKCSAIYTQKNGGHCHWSDKDKKRLRILAKQNPYFNGTIKSTPPLNSLHLKKGIIKICPNCKILFYVAKSVNLKKTCSLKCAKQIGIMGGLRCKSGRGKQGWYKGYYCNSSWELAWIIYQLEHNIKFKRNTQGFQYEFNGKKYKFYPDFILDNGDYVEIKGYMDKKNNSKISYFPYKINVIGKNNLKYIFDYVINKYGDNYTSLYEKSDTN
jgi:hypothetical protein